MIPRTARRMSVAFMRNCEVSNPGSRLQTSQLRIDAPDIAQEDHKNIAAVLFCSRRVCCGRLHAPAGSSKDIQFPRNGKASLKIVEFDRNDNGRILRSGWPDDPLAIASAGGRAVDRRKITRPSNATRCPRFLHAFKSQLEV